MRDVTTVHMKFNISFFFIFFKLSFGFFFERRKMGSFFQDGVTFYGRVDAKSLVVKIVYSYLELTFSNKWRNIIL